MRTPLCDQLGIEHPIIGFTPSEHVAAAISRAGGLGVLGCVRFNDATELDKVLSWLDDSTDGRPYGVDVVMPATIPTEGAALDLNQLIPAGHRDFVEHTLANLGVPPLPPGARSADGVLGWLHSVARTQVEVALGHRARLIANALGSPPADVIASAHDRGMLVAALAGKAAHARSHVAAGVDIVVAQGYEAGGHTGEIATMVLVPEVVDAVGPQVPVLAAGGIGSGQQIAAALALGAQGAWTGSQWLMVEESSNTPVQQAAYVKASSRDTVRSRSFTGKPARMLRNDWTEAWERPDNPKPLGMPLQYMVSGMAVRATNRYPNESVDVAFNPVGQVVGQFTKVEKAATVIERWVQEYLDATTRLDELNAAAAV